MKMVPIAAGEVFGRLTVLENRVRDKLVSCRCECGALKELPGNQLLRGMTRSCGCLKRDTVIQRSTKHGHSPAAGLTPEYMVWASMVQRATNPDCKYYARYGGRGITLCERWMSFSNFIADMGPRPVVEGVRYTLERIDNDGPYSPENCRWDTYRAQAKNRRHWSEWANHGARTENGQYARVS